MLSHWKQLRNTTCEERIVLQNLFIVELKMFESKSGRMSRSGVMTIFFHLLSFVQLHKHVSCIWALKVVSNVAMEDQIVMSSNISLLSFSAIKS